MGELGVAMKSDSSRENFPVQGASTTFEEFATLDTVFGGEVTNTADQGGLTSGASDHWLPKLDVAGSNPVARSSDCQITHEPNEVYHLRPEFSTSQIKDFCDDVLAFHGRHVVKTAPPKKSTALDYGTKVHLRCEVGEKAWASRKLVAPAKVLTAAGFPNKDWDSWQAEIQAASPDAIPLTPADDAQLDAQFAGIFRNPKARELLDDTIDREFAVSCVWEGFPVRCRCDGATPYGWYDIKTTREARPKQDWYRSAVQYRYHYQAAIYQELAMRAGWPPHELIFIVTSTQWPYACHCMTLPPALVDQGRFEVLAALSEIQQRIQFDHWTPDDYGSVFEMPCPAYLKEYRYGR